MFPHIAVKHKAQFPCTANPVPCVGGSPGTESLASVAQPIRNFRIFLTLWDPIGFFLPFLVPGQSRLPHADRNIWGE